MQVVPFLVRASHRVNCSWPLLMKPYRQWQWLRAGYSALLRHSLVGVLITSSLAAQTPKKPDVAGPVSAQYSYATAKNNALTHSGFEHYYELQYPESIRDFQQVWSERPQDPFAANHLAAALFFDQLYRAGALESTAFANNSFLNNHSPLHMDPVVDAKLKALLARALQLEN